MNDPYGVVDPDAEPPTGVLGLDPSEFPKPVYFGVSTKTGKGSFLLKSVSKIDFKIPAFFCLLCWVLSKLGSALSLALSEIK